MKIPRWYELKIFGQSAEIQLHFFCDASTSARGSVCYLRCLLPDSSITCSLVMGKALLPGPGRHTIPRLELEAALDAVNMCRVIRQELDLNDCPCIFWSDSMIVLQSLLAETKKFSMFSRNRLQRILAHTSAYDWRYVLTNLNPADQASQGMTSEALLRSGMWLSGPDFLRKPPEKWPQNPVQKPQSNSFCDYNKIAQSCAVHTAALLTNEDVKSVDKLISYFSSFHRLKLATAWLLRIKAHLKCRVRGEEVTTCGTPISCHELDNAERELVKYQQAQSFPSWIRPLSEGKQPKISKNSFQSLAKLNPILVNEVLRVGGRIDRANLGYEVRHPAILDQESHLTSLIISHYHCEQSKHFGEGHTLNQIAQKYWILNAKSAVKRIIKDCLIWRRRTAKPCQQIMAELPESRLQIGEAPFTQTGVDYFGPLIVRVGRSDVKRYGCLFTCLTTRAIHLEVASDLTTSSFINALRRFAARRGPVKSLHSDNGTNFVGCKKTLKKALDEWNQHHIQDHLRQQGIDWKFSPPTSSNFGGAWERMIRTVRQDLMNILPKRPLTDDVLHTLLLDVEDIVNSRPLTEVRQEVDGALPLTPNHLFKLNSCPNMAPLVTGEKDLYHREKFRAVQFLADKFWRQWIQEYPRSLLPRTKWLYRKRNIQENDIVLLMDDSTPRQSWPLGRVTKPHFDRHGDVRSATVKTSTGVLERPINKLCVIVPSNPEEVDTEAEEIFEK